MIFHVVIVFLYGFHMITCLRQEACSGAIDDLGHVVTKCMMADGLTKDKPDARAPLEEAVRTGTIVGCDANPPFRELIKGKHKAYLCEWLCRNV